MTRILTAVAMTAALLTAEVTLAQAKETSKPAADPKVASSTTSEKPAAADESPLVRAAREGAANRTKKSRLSIQDKDVKKSKTKLIETTSKPLPPVPSAAEAADRAQRSREATALSEEKARTAATARLEEARNEVSNLESELRRIEETYYDEDDADFREEVIEKKFNDTAARLEKARQELEAARTAAAERGVSTP